MIHRGSHEVITIGQNLSFVFLMREGQLVHSESYRCTVAVAGNDPLAHSPLGNGALIYNELRPFGGYCERLKTIISDEIQSVAKS